MSQQPAPVISRVQSAANSRVRLTKMLDAVSRDASDVERSEFLALLALVDPTRLLEQKRPERVFMHVETLTKRSLPRLTNRHFFQYKMDGKGALAAFFRSFAGARSNLAEMNEGAAGLISPYTMVYMEISGKLRAIDNVALPFRYNLPVMMQMEIGLRKTLNPSEWTEFDKPFECFLDHHYMEPDDGSDDLNGRFTLVAGVFDLLYFPRVVHGTTRIVANDVLANHNADERLKRLFSLMEASPLEDVRIENAAMEAETALERCKTPIELFLKMCHPAVNVVAAVKSIPVALVGVLLDGVVFMPDMPYVPGLHRYLLKWKSSYTVDFVIKRPSRGRYRLYVMDEKRQLCPVSVNIAYGETEEEVDETLRVLAAEFDRQATSKELLVLEFSPYIERQGEFRAAIAEMIARHAPLEDILKRGADWIRWQPNGILRHEKPVPNFIDVYWSNIEAITNQVTLAEIVAQIDPMQNS